MKIHIKVSVVVHDTESESKVKKAVQNLFPSLKFTTSEKGISGESDDIKSLDHLRELLKDQKIRSTANTILKRSLFEDILVFYLNKQAAFMGKVNFSQDSPLDPITVSVTGSNLPALITYLSPRSTEE